MKFDLITDNGSLWAVRYDNCLDNVLDALLDQWNDVVWLRSFFKQNISDLTAYFKITDVNQAIYDTIEDSEKLQCLIMDISPNANLDEIFRPLENSRSGGAIKLARTMQEREHTLVELARMEKVRNYLIDNGISDMDSFKDYLCELS